MKKYILLLAVFVSISSVCLAETSSSLELTSTSSPAEIKAAVEKVVQTENGALASSQKNIIDDLFSKMSAPRQGLQKIFDKMQEENGITQEEQDLLEIQLQKEILEEINLLIGGEIDQMQKELAENENLKGDLSAANKMTDEYTAKIEELESSQEDLRKKIFEKEGIITENKKNIEQLSEAEVMKNYLLQQNLELKKLLDSVENRKIDAKMIILYVGLAIFVLAYLVKFLLKRKHKINYQHHFTYFDLIWGFSFFSFLVWFFFYVKPEMTIILFFLAGGFVVVSRDFIVSLLASLLIVNEFHIGDKIRFNGQEGIIVKIRPMWLVIRNIDKYDHATGEARRIPNYVFMSKEVVRIRRTEEKEYFKLALNREYKLNIFRILKYIETEILQKNITTKLRNEITGEEMMYDLDYHYNDDGEPVIEITWKETREKSRRIKKKIMAYISSMIFKEEVKEPVDAGNLQKGNVGVGQTEGIGNSGLDQQNDASKVESARDWGITN